ncbi:hypothetical protein ACFWIW_14280 [Amycolatopsis sp. NPDC058340]
MHDEDDEEFLYELEAEYKAQSTWGGFEPPPHGGPPFRSRR